VKDGSITVNCTATDDRKLTTSASAAVKVVQRPNAKKFGRIDFVHDLKRPTRVDNQAKGELDRYADALAAEPEAKGVVVGYATEKEEKEEEVKNGSEPHPSVAALRGVNTKDYLRRDKGIDGARIEARAGRGRKSADLWVVPAEARLKLPGTTVVDESKVKAIPRVTHHRKTKKAAQTAHKKAGKSSGGVQSKHVQSKHVQSKQAQGKHPVPVPKKKGKRR
jgi:hypothetical protein